MLYNTSNRAWEAFEKAFDNANIPKMTNNERDGIIEKLNAVDSDKDLLNFVSNADGELLNKLHDYSNRLWKSSDGQEIILPRAEQDRKELIFILAKMYIGIKRVQTKNNISREELYKAIDAVLLMEEYNANFDGYIDCMFNKGEEEVKNE